MVLLHSSFCNCPPPSNHHHHDYSVPSILASLPIGLLLLHHHTSGRHYCCTTRSIQHQCEVAPIVPRYCPYRVRRQYIYWTGVEMGWGRRGNRIGSNVEGGRRSNSTFQSFPPRRGFEFNFSKVSRQDEDSNSTFQKFPANQDEGSNSTFQKFPAKTRVRIQLFKSFPPRRGFEFNFSKVSRQDFDLRLRQPPAASRQPPTTNDERLQLILYSSNPTPTEYRAIFVFHHVNTSQTLLFLSVAAGLR